MRNIAIVAATALALAGCAAAPASTTTSTGPTITAPTVISSVNDSLTALRNFSMADLAAASADAKAQVPPDTTSAMCYDWLGANLPTLPNVQAGQTVGVILAFQKARDLANGAQGGGNSGFMKSLNIACAPLVNDVNVTLAKLGVLAGGIAATGGALGPILPAIGAALPLPLN